MKTSDHEKIIITQKKKRSYTKFEETKVTQSENEKKLTLETCRRIIECWVLSSKRTEENFSLFSWINFNRYSRYVKLLIRVSHKIEKSQYKSGYSFTRHLNLLSHAGNFSMESSSIFASRRLLLKWNIFPLISPRITHKIDRSQFVFIKRYEEKLWNCTRSEQWNIKKKWNGEEKKLNLPFKV